ncbi:hypothetical protein LTR02_016500 [Friedmanniomyces endolithicus]|nr:hypothetical protein LTR02_016500 [Friedmanniomyces endolithicus]
MGEQSPSAVFHQDVDAVHADLYDGLFVHSLLQHETNQQASSANYPSPNTSQDVRSTWHRFLDDLCFMCDSRCGGKSVVALITEQVQGETIFWLTTDPVYQDSAANHLDAILRLLKESIHAHQDCVRLAIEQIAQQSVERSPQRVHHYGSRLRRIVQEQIPRAGSEVPLVDVALHKELDYIVSVRDLHQKLCDVSYHFRYQAGYALLKQHIEASSEDTWTRVRHFIGRLGHWNRTAVSLARVAESFASVLQNYRIASIPYPDSGEKPRLTLDEDLKELVLRVFPNYRATPLCDRLVTRISRAENLLNWFRSNRLVPRPHAEVVAMEFCCSQGMHLVSSDRYVACSKPSCYCCSLYMSHHPGGFRPRPTHGNVWVLWCLPQLFHHDQSSTVNLGILRRMANDTRNFSKASLTNSRTASRRKFDSTTGISTAATGPDR